MQAASIRSSAISGLVLNTTSLGTPVLRRRFLFVPLEDEVAEGTAEWGAFEFMFVLGVLSFAGAKPWNMSELEYEEKDEFKLSDFIERLRFVRGELRFDADYIRGRRIKTRIVVRSNGTVTLETIGRGKAALRWLDQLKGKKLIQLVDP